MLKIHEHQVHALGQALITDQFIADTVSYLDQALDQNTAFYGRDAVIATIFYGIERARSYDIVSHHGVSLYLRLMFTLMGSDFDQDPLYPWAAKILSDSYHPPNDKIMRLTGMANQFLDEVKDKETEYFRKVLASCRSNPFSRLPETADAYTIEHETIDEIKRSFPGKLSCVGEDSVARLIRRGVEDARALKIQRGPDIAAFAFFMFVHGVRFYCDPKYPRAKSIFYDPDLSGSEKVDAMFAEARSFLHRKLHLLKLQ
jgi:hypothetical protein